MVEETQAHELKEYHGNCHCGNFRFSVKLAPLKQVMACNCSICSRNGYLWAFPTGNFTIEKGDGSLKQYEFGKRQMMHEFCPNCGTSILGRRNNASGGMDMGINVRALNDVDLGSLEIKMYDGAKLEPPYQAPKASSHVAKHDGEGEVEVYEGCCHCGAITYTLKTKPLNQAEVTYCNCSICSRNGDLWIYTGKDSVALHGEENIKSYLFGPKTQSHEFCGVCGVSVSEGLTKGVLAINARTLNDIDLADLKVEDSDGKALLEGAKYGT